MGNVVTRRKAAARMVSVAASLLATASLGHAQPATSSPQGDPHQSRSVFELSQQAQPPAAKPALRMPRLAGPERRGDGKPIARLSSVRVDGVHALDPALIADAYRAFLGTMVSQADLAAIAAAITEQYRAAGFHLSRAIIPVQDLAGGVLRIKVVEGSVAELALQGEADRFGAAALLAPIAAESPSRFSTFERQLLLVNDLPGVRIKDTVLDEIGTGSGRFRLTIVLETWSVYAAFGADNLGSKAVGPLQTYGTATLNSSLTAGDALTVSASAAPQHPTELLYGLVAYDAPVGTSGVRLGVSAWHSSVWPGDQRREFGTKSESSVVEARASVAPWQSQLSSLRLTGAIAAGEFVEKDDFGLTYRDQVRTVSFRADYAAKDPWGGQNYVGAGVRQGVPAFGASREDDPFRSRFAPADFAVLELGVTRLQTITEAWSVRLAGAAQWASAPLYASQQFYVGGASFGRGYDAALIGGDNGMGGSAELRVDHKLAPPFLKNVQLYVFADGGRVWNLHSDLGAQWLVSAGGGLRLTFQDDWQAGLAVAFPVDGDLFNRPSMGPRLLFSLSKSLRLCPERAQAWCG